MNELLAWMTLSQLSSIGPVTFWHLVDSLGSPQAVLQASARELSQRCRLSPKQLLAFERTAEVAEDCAEQCARMKEENICCLTAIDPRYPPLLKHIKSPPAVLYARGNIPLLQQVSIAVVGSRAATSYGTRMAFGLAEELGRYGVVVVSGLALGIDSQAHRGALAGDGGTVAVLGCGLDVVYPWQNRELYQRIGSSGVLVSEYLLGTQPEAFRFPARNRIISGMSYGVVVVEAARKSGSLITASMALEEGREVYAVPGQADSYKSEGAHWLLQQGAKLVVKGADIIEDMQFVVNLESKSLETLPSKPSLGATAEVVLSALEVYPVARDTLSQQTGLGIPEISEALLLLELEGLIEILPGNEIRRLH